MRAISRTRSSPSTRANLRGGARLCHALFDDEVVVRSRGHRREVRDGEYLLALADLGEAVTDLLSDLTAQSGVDLVEDRNRLLVDGLEGEG